MQDEGGHRYVCTSDFFVDYGSEYLVMDQGVRSVLTPLQATQVTSLAYTRNAHMAQHHVAVVISRKTGNVIASATNEAMKTGSVHAECAALEQLRRRLRNRALPARDLRRGVLVLSLRVSRSGTLLLAKPCSACENTLRRCPYTKRVGWSDDDGKIVCRRCEGAG